MENHSEIALLAKITWTEFTFLLKEAILVSCAANHLNPCNLCEITCQSTIETEAINDNVNVLGVVDTELRLQELAALYLVRAEAGGPLQCTLCSKTFRDSFNAKRHLDSKHFPNPAGYACDVCAKVCKSWGVLINHKNMYHKQSLK